MGELGHSEQTPAPRSLVQRPAGMAQDGLCQGGAKHRGPRSTCFGFPRGWGGKGVRQRGKDTTHTDLARSHGRLGGGNNAAEQRDAVREPSPVRLRREGKGRGGGQPEGAGRSVRFRESRVSSQPF